MVLRHLWGFYFNPQQEWHQIDESHETLASSIQHLLLMAFIPSLCAYISTVHLGWQLLPDKAAYLSPASALTLSTAMYVAIIFGTCALAYLIKWMSATFGSSPGYSQSFEVASYSASPLFLAGLALLYPQPLFVVFVMLIGLAYSVYLLYSGIPVLMHISKEQGFIYASSIVTCALVLLVSGLVLTVILWSLGMHPEFQV